MTPEEHLAALGHPLPPVPPPVGSYVPWARTGNLVFTSGQLPLREGRLTMTGKVGSDLSVEQGAETARVAVLNGLAQIADAAGALDRVRAIVRLCVYVNSTPGFTDQAKVANGASDLLAEVFGEAGRHARSAVGASDLPLDAPVELELVVELAD